MRSRTLIFVLLVLQTYALVSTSTSLHQRSESESESCGDVRAKCGLPKLFDFEPFKRLYHKQYNSTIEEMRRLKTYLARCYQVFISAVSYSHGLKSYYLRIGEHADWLPEEIEASENKFTTAAVLQESGDTSRERDTKKAAHVGETREVLAEPEELIDELNTIRAKADAEPELKLLVNELDKLDQSCSKRMKRNVDGTRPDFSIEQAFVKKTGDSTNNPLRCASQPEIGSTRAPLDYSSLPDYKATGTYAIQYTRQKGRDYDQLPVKNKHRRRGILAKMTRMFQSEEKLARNVKAQREKSTTKRNGVDDDIIWVDHRIGSCFQPVQHQGSRCGSCYVFTMISYLEWLHCSMTTERIKLSEQYIVDCGPLLGLKGCAGGNHFDTSEFISNFGLELAKDYPYFGSQNKCPHKSGKDMESMGYLRADVSNILVIDMHHFEHYLDRWTIILDIQAVGDFLWYGGGVWASKSCDGESGNHSVLIVGHGREDGEEYWLIRNSHGSDWGEQGYMKLNKNSKCIGRSRGYIIGTRDGIGLSLSIRRNNNVAEPIKPKPSLMSLAFNPRLAMRVLS